MPPQTAPFTWELGGGMGHMMQILALARGLRQRGHHIFVAVRDLSRACCLFKDEENIALLAAPAKTGPPANPIRPPHTLAHILHNVGYASALELAGLTAGWRGLFQTVRPDVIVFDHSPTAMLASRGFPARRVVLGAGFFCPPDEYPLPNLRPWQPADARKLLADELETLGRMNALLNHRQHPPLQGIGQLYTEVGAGGRGQAADVIPTRRTPRLDSADCATARNPPQAGYADTHKQDDGNEDNQKHLKMNRGFARH